MPMLEEFANAFQPLPNELPPQQKMIQSLQRAFPAHPRSQYHQQASAMQPHPK